MQKKPFFILGCVRSGTTFLRNVLRQHPHLVCPEETHFFRWSDAFATPVSLTVLQNNNTLKKHRQLDKVSEEQFKDILHNSTSRADLQRRYMQLYMANNNLQDKRWFDKTPQNFYGAALIATDFPESKFIHIVRNPLDVVASLRIGNVVKIENLIGACNLWNEAAQSIHVLRRAYPGRVYEIKYDQFSQNLFPELKKILSYVDEDFQEDYFQNIEVREKSYQHEELFTVAEIKTIKRLCGRWARHYGFTDACLPREIKIKTDAKPVKGAVKAATQPLLSLPDAIAVIDRFKALKPYTTTPAIAIPRTVFQYWDNEEPPEQIKTLNQRNRSLCQGNKIDYVFFDDVSAREFIKEHFAENVYRAYDVAPHAAMKCDLFRLCYLYQCGGFYLDADMIFTENIAQLFSFNAELVVFKWDTEKRITVLNGVIGAMPQSEIIAFVLNAATTNVLNACQLNPQQALRNILTVSGPVLFTRAIASFIAEKEKEDATEQSLLIKFERVETMLRYWAKNGPDFLKKPLEYKSTPLHWLVAGKNTQ